jgi:hypothetical protein
MAIDPKHEDQVLSEDYKVIAGMLVFQLVGMVKAGGEEWVPPFEIVITGADGDPVAHLQVTTEGTVRNLNHSHFTLRAHFPVTAVITDQSGNARELVFSPTDETVQ